jgi:pectin methylesterase-like acyl-CoA thioesterase
LVLSVFFVLPSSISAQENKETLRSLSIPSSLQRDDIVVAQDGSGKFKTIQEAFNAVPENSNKRTVIFIKNGLYKEKLVLSISKKNVTIIGESVDGVTLTYDDHSGKFEGNKFGYVFLNCKLTADSGITGVTLGRPWRPYAKVVYISCEIGAHIDSAGWNNWKKPDAEKTTFYAEYKCKGPGSVTTKRVSWSKQLNAEEATEYTLSNIFSANASATPFNSDWNP